jgi:DNA-binding transcriptional ArsR family regulator
MEGTEPHEEAGVFRALADSTRRQILEELRPGELSAGEIASRFPISGPSVSRHLGVLKAAGLIRVRRVANRIFYSLVEERLAVCVSRFLSTVCPEQFIFRQRARGSPEKGSGHETALDVEHRRTTPSGELPR